MASDSQTATATTSEKPLENKMDEEAKLMEKEIVLEETVDVVKDKAVSDSNLTVTREENINQTPGGEQEKEPHADVEEIAVVVKADESTEKGADENGEKKVELEEPTPVKQSVEAGDSEKAEGKGKDENGEQKVAEQVELKEPTLLIQSVEEVKVEAADAEKAEGKGENENGEEKVAEQVELKEQTPVKEGVEEVKLQTVEKTEEKGTVESVAEEDNKDKEETKVVDVSESTDEAAGKQVNVQLVREVPAETVEVEPKHDASEKVETQPEKANELATDVEVVKTEEKTEQAKVEHVGKLEDSVVETKDSGINSRDEQTSESGSMINQESDTAPQKEPEGDASSPADVTEKAITEEKHVVEEPSKDEKPSESVSVFCPEKVDPDRNLETKTEGDVSSPADVTEKAITEEKHVVEEPSKDEKENVATEEENIKKDTVTPAADVKSEEALKETEGTKQEESITEKVAEVVETAPVVKEIEEPEVTTKEVVVKQKSSNSIMSKVKKSLVKAKKAIIGKSPSSKTISTEETKEEIKAK